MDTHTSQCFIHELQQHQNEAEIEKMKKYFKGSDENTKCLGLNMRTVFQLAKQFTDMPLTEVERLLENDYYEVRMGAVSIMDFQAKAKKLPEENRQALYELYIRRHDRINNWDLVDRAAPSVIGTYLLDKPKDKLYELAHSSTVWERRTAMVSTHSFIKAGNTETTFAIAEILIHDPEDFINKAVGSFIREAGKKDGDKLKSFLNKHAHTMPRITLRYAIEKFDKSTRDYYLNRKKS
ncbi:DNA alkylation repair protein [Shouchella patagoniensis]|uniref:DNA alkylation repair protein n=1 Tax=Shouchella patagoniensis TaxID=228576 RepID=UPI00099537E1|nr:DNA alkylation repair protein [Shouchella patagoniensis]